MHYYFINLMFFDLVQAVGELIPKYFTPKVLVLKHLLGGMMDIKWISQAVSDHPLFSICSAKRGSLGSLSR